MNIDQIIDRLPFELAARLESDPFFNDIPIVVFEAGNLASEIAKKQGLISVKSGKRGVTVIVPQLYAEDEFPGVPGGPMKLRPSFLVLENVELNHDEEGTKKSHRKIARHIIRVMKIIGGFQGIVQGLQCDTPAIEPFVVKDQDSIKASQVNFVCQEFSDQQELWCLPPVITAVANSNPPQVTLASATLGCTLWYTTDDTFPYPGDATQFHGSTSLQYTGPLTLPGSGVTLIRACAYRAGYTASSIIRQSIITQPA